MKTGVLFFILLFFLTSCGEEAVDWKLEDRAPDTIVVEAIVTSDRHHFRVKLSQPFYKSDESPMAVTGATVSIRRGQETYLLEETTGSPGLYVNPVYTDNPIGATYYLEVIAEGKTYRAKAVMPPVNVFDHIGFNRVPDTDSMMIGQVPKQFNEFEQAMYEITIDWSHLSSTAPTRAKLYYYTFNTVDVSQIFAPEKEKVRFPVGSYVIVRKHSLSPEYAEYLRALVAETQWQGGIFEETRDNLPTNISNGGLGFFSACAVLTDTLVAE